MDKEFGDFISAVLDKTDIIALISRYTKVERRGSTYWACCPFHHETQPSFSVSADKQLFHCFGCKESGNALSFLMKMEHIEFIDALKMLAEQAGMEVPKPKGREYTRERMETSRRNFLYGLTREAARHYHANLSSPRAKQFNDYIAARNIPAGMVRKFGLGASLDFTEMLEYLKSKGYTYQDMYDAGIAECKDGRYYDVFGKRLMFPVLDNMNNIIAFGGRTLEKDAHFAKYRNSSETNFFEKSQAIYGINLLKRKKNEGSPIDYAIVAEGYMDVIALHKAGFDTAVATMGTAFNTKQARQLKLYCERVYISYDGDTAGQKAIMRGLDILKDVGFTVKVVRLPDGLDPDEIIARDGPEGYQKLLDEALTLTDHKLNVLKSGFDFNDPDQRAQYAVEAVAIIKGMDNAVEQNKYLDRVSEITGFPVDALRRQADLAEIAKKMQPRTVTDEAPPTKLDDNVKFFLASIVQCRDYIDFDRIVTDVMPDEFTSRLYDWCRTHAGYTTVDIFNEYGYDNAILNELVEYKPIPGDNRKRFTDVEIALYRKVIEKEIKRLNAMTAKNARDPAIEKRIMELSLEQAKLKNYRS